MSHRDRIYGKKRIVSWQEFLLLESAEETSDSTLTKLFKALGSALSSSWLIFPAIKGLLMAYDLIWGKKPTKVRLIFPGEDWEEYALELIKGFGIFTGIFKDTGEAIETVKSLAKQGVKADEFVVGSHGNGKLLLMPSKRSETSFPEFLEESKKILKPDTTIFFTACHGADDLLTLVKAANDLEQGVYGSKGIYNYVTNSSEKGYYYCNPHELRAGGYIPVEDYEYPDNFEVVTPGEDRAEVIILGAYGKKNRKDGNSKMGEFTMRISDAGLKKLGWSVKTPGELYFPIPDEKIFVTSESYSIPMDPDDKFYDLYLEGKVFRYKIAFRTWDFFVPGSEKETISNLKRNGYHKLAALAEAGDAKISDKEKRGNFGVLLKDAIEKGEIVILDNNGDDVTKRPRIKPHEKKTKEEMNSDRYLLECGACKKIKSSPISWLEPTK